MADGANQGGGMVYRLGWVLYWFTCIVGVLLTLLALLQIGLLAFGGIADAVAFWNPFLPFWTKGVFPTLPQNIVLIALVWATGRAVRYVLSGD